VFFRENPKYRLKKYGKKLISGETPLDSHLPHFSRHFWRKKLMLHGPLALCHTRF
jgi:hypothetical protein